MNVASLELCKELYKLSKWVLTEKHWYKGKPVYHAPYGWDCPAYDLSVLLEKLLPQNTWVGYTDTSGQRGYALAKTYAWNEKGDDIDKIAECRADTPEDAACKLSIELFKQGVFKRGQERIEAKHYTWEEKIESLVKLAKAAGSFTNTDRGTEGYKVTREHLIRAYDEFCEWRHEEPYVVDEIKQLIGKK